MMMDITRGGAMRRWVMGKDGIKRWLDSGELCEPACDRSACGDYSPGPCDNPDCEALIQPARGGD